MVTGLVLDDAGFEMLVAGQRIGPRRLITDDDATLLRSLADRYVHAVHAHADDATFVALGRELFAWLDGDQGQLSDLLTRALAPATFEVRAPKHPADKVWSVLRAPFEVLARPQGGFLAEDALLRFEVVRRLGRAETPPDLGDLRLGLMFMASSPRGQFELDFEAEETAILDAVGDTRVDLVVEDTGDPEQLGHRLADLGGMPVVHLSCHGVNNWRTSEGAPGMPVLMMENEVGDGRPTSAPELVRLFTTLPRLVFVSACLTATGADARGHLPAGAGRRDLVGEPGDATAVIAHSMATGLVTAGIPAVIGWDGSVTDVAATLFAEELYRRLGARADLAVAVGDARRRLLAETHREVRADWHLARIWLGPTGGGPVVAGKRKRTLVSAAHGTKAFLDKKKQHVPVAAPSMFVGRRRELRRSLLTLRDIEHAGVLLHGQGRLGKSSLAARIADRLNDRAVAVVFGDYSALGVLDAIATAVTTNREARELIDRRLPEVRDRPEALESLLIDLVSGPCAQSGPSQRPLLLIVDDLEQILEPHPTGDHRVTAAHAPVIAAILRAFDPDATDSRLLFTSRFRFALDGLESRLDPIQLEPLSEASQRKLSTRQKALTSDDIRMTRKDLARRAVAVSHGNPGLQDLIGLRLVYSAEVDDARAETIVSGMESYLAQGDLPSDAEVRDFMENLALDALIDLAGAVNVEMLRDMTLFDLPVPAKVTDILSARTSRNLDRLLALGLADTFPDAFRPEQPATAANGLTAGRLLPLSEAERTKIAVAVVSSLHMAWGGAGAEDLRSSVLALQLTRLGLLADHPEIILANAVGAVREMRAGHAGEACSLGLSAIAVLDRHGFRVPTRLLRQVVDAALADGRGDVADRLLERAVSGPVQGNDDLLERARAITAQAHRLIAIGELARGEEGLRHAQDLFESNGAEYEAIVTQGAIARVLASRGEYEEALRIHRDVQLPAYERLGESREWAAAWGNIAEIQMRQGHHEEALRIRLEVELPVYERFGESRESAVTWGKIADIRLYQGEYDEVLRIHRQKQLPVYERLGESRESATAWGRVAHVAVRRGEFEEALRIRREIQLPIFERLRETREIALTWSGIADVYGKQGNDEEELRIRREIELPIYERIGDLYSAVITWGQVADILFRRGDHEEALSIRRDLELPIRERLGEPKAISNTRVKLATIELALGNQGAAAAHLMEAFRIVSRVGDSLGIAAVGATMGMLLFRSEPQTAREVLRQGLAAAVEHGHEEWASRIGATLAEMDSADDTGRLERGRAGHGVGEQATKEAER